MADLTPERLEHLRKINPWRMFIENCISGDNYFRSSEYYQLMEELDAFYEAKPVCDSCQNNPANYKPETPIAWRVWNGRWFYFDDQPHWTIGAVFPLYGASTTEPQT